VKQDTGGRIIQPSPGRTKYEEKLGKDKLMGPNQETWERRGRKDNTKGSTIGGGHREYPGQRGGPKKCIKGGKNCLRNTAGGPHITDAKARPGTRIGENLKGAKVADAKSVKNGH